MNKEMFYAFAAMLLSAPLLMAVPFFEYKYGTPKAVTTLSWFAGEIGVIAIVAVATGQLKPLAGYTGNPGMWLALVGGAVIGTGALFCMMKAFGGDEPAAIVMTIANANPAVAVLGLMFLGLVVKDFPTGISDKQTFGVFLSIPVFYLLASK